MRIVSWTVVGASVTALAWSKGSFLSGVVEPLEFDASQAVGTVAKIPRPASIEVQRSAQLAQANGGAVATFTGSESDHTREFEVTAPWIIDWRVTSNGGYELAVDVSLEQAGTGVHMGSVLKTKSTGNGVRLFEEEGRFYLRINSSFANWSLKVIQLTSEEAESYTPLTPGG